MQLQGNSSQPVIIQTAPIATGTQAQLIQVFELLFLVYPTITVNLQVAQQNSNPQVFLAQNNPNTENDSVN